MDDFVQLVFNYFKCKQNEKNRGNIVVDIKINFVCDDPIKETRIR